MNPSYTAGKRMAGRCARQVLFAVLTKEFNVTWNRTKSILGTDKNRDGVIHEADTIFSAVFIGMVIDRGVEGFRVDMEPEMDPALSREERSRADRGAMQRLNNLCAKVNHIVRSYERNLEEKRGIHWGLTPAFFRGGVISGGPEALRAYGSYSERFLASAWRYLTLDRGEGGQSVYIGRGAYCGLVVVDNETERARPGEENEATAIAAMSTLRTTLGPDSPLASLSGDRWLPPRYAEVFVARRGDDVDFAWGMIGGSELQTALRDQGMKFVPEGEEPDPQGELVGYTHGMVRAIYECARIGKGWPYEMSLGQETAKLASCMSCSLFMIANGYPPSSSHLGKGESWLPLYHTHQHTFSYLPSAKKGVSDDEALQEAIRVCNEKWAAQMRRWMITGVRAMTACVEWVDEQHRASLRALEKRLDALGHSPGDLLVSANLYLDAMTVHESDAVRLNRTLRFGPDPRPECGPSAEDPARAEHDWLAEPWRKHVWMMKYEEQGWASFDNPFSTAELLAFREKPQPR